MNDKTTMTLSDVLYKLKYKRMPIAKANELIKSMIAVSNRSAVNELFSIEELELLSVLLAPSLFNMTKGNTKNFEYIVQKIESLKMNRALPK